MWQCNEGLRATVTFIHLVHFGEGIAFLQHSCKVLSAFEGFRGGQRSATYWAIEEPRGGE